MTTKQKEIWINLLEHNDEKVQAKYDPTLKVQLSIPQSPPGISRERASLLPILFTSHPTALHPPTQPPIKAAHDCHCLKNATQLGKKFQNEFFHLLYLDIISKVARLVLPCSIFWVSVYFLPLLSVVDNEFLLHSSQTTLHRNEYIQQLNTCGLVV